MKERSLQADKLVEFLQIVEDWRMSMKIEESAIYRGHTDFNWILIAKLFRDPNTKAENKKGDDKKQIEEQLLSEHLSKDEAYKLEHRLFQDFSRYLYAYRPDLVSTVSEEEKSNNTRAMQEWRQLALAQHYGLPTRLLDFSTNVLVALFFAVEGSPAHRKTTNGEEQEQDSAVWCIKASNRLKVWQVWKPKGVWLSPLEFAKEGSNPPIAKFIDMAFVPEHFDGRVRAQGSVFMCEPRGKDPNFTLHKKLCASESTIRIRVPRNYRASLLEQLDSVGINRATLFPDLESAAKYLAWAIHQRKRYYQKK